MPAHGFWPVAHTTPDLTAEYWEDYAEIAGIEMIHIGKETTIEGFKKELRMNEVYYMLNKALC